MQYFIINYDVSCGYLVHTHYIVKEVPFANILYRIFVSLFMNGIVQ